MTELSKAYNPKDVETRIYEFWEKNGYFKPENQRYLNPDEKPFVITIPPPNVTGTLHMGHALTAATEDLMTRYHRMKGARTLWVPGTDHAGIATQAVVEKKLAKEGKNRREMSRSDFIEEVWAWKEYSHTVITNQSKKLGISVDWDREAFTMDENLSLAVRTAFKRMYDKGLIYRDTRMVNWDPVQLTGVSDLEAVTEDEGEPGHLWHVRYPIQTNRWEGPRHEWGSGQWAEGATHFITVATTRPETILGDSAVMVHPDDERYTDLVGCRAILPVLGRWTPIISDEAVEKDFGSGAVKVTPAHDFTDYEVGKRHHLAFIEVLDQHAKMNAEAGPYAGLDRFECRKRLVKDLEKEGLLVKVEDYQVRLARGERSGAVIEPRISMQWFCNMQDMGARAAAAVREKKIKIVPERFERVWFQWLDNIRDWNISRQLWWGHQIPVWYVERRSEGSESSEGSKVQNVKNFTNLQNLQNLPNSQSLPTQYCELTEAEAYAKARADWGDDVTLVQDTDVLDTWFSSGLWPFSTLGWPNATEDMAKYYPTTMLETGYDIIFFWVARMVMMGLELTDQVPFDTIYLHGLIRQNDGKKMSKSRPEKAVDPLDMIDAYGSDALRFYLITAGAPGNDIKVEVKTVDGKKQVERIEGARNFANKLWNAARFVLGKIASSESSESLKVQSLHNQWITARATDTVANVRKLMDEYQYGEAGKLIYEFTWNDFCDWYVELAKLDFNRETAETTVATLDTILRLLHPFMPFITEEIWQKLKEVASGKFQVESLGYPALILAPFPAIERKEDSLEVEPAAFVAKSQMETLQDVITQIRIVRADYKLTPDKRVAAIISAAIEPDVQLLETNRDAIVSLARVYADQLVIGQNLSAPDKCVSVPMGSRWLYVPLSGLVDLDAEKKRLSDELAALEQSIIKSENLLNSDFGKRAPANVIEKEKTKMADAQQKITQLKDRLAAM